MNRLILSLSLTLATLTLAQPKAPVPPSAPRAPMAPMAPLPPMPPRWGMGGLHWAPGIPQAMAQKLGISAEVTKKVRDQTFEANDQLIQLEADLKRAQLDLERALSATSPDEATVLGKLEVVNKTELAVRKNRMSLLLRIRTTLGPVMWEKLQGEFGSTTVDEGQMLSGGVQREVKVIRRINGNGEVETEEIHGP